MSKLKVFLDQTNKSRPRAKNITIIAKTPKVVQEVMNALTAIYNFKVTPILINQTIGEMFHDGYQLITKGHTKTYTPHYSKTFAKAGKVLIEETLAQDIIYIEDTLQQNCEELYRYNITCIHGGIIATYFKNLKYSGKIIAITDGTTTYDWCQSHISYKAQLNTKDYSIKSNETISLLKTAL